MPGGAGTGHDGGGGGVGGTTASRVLLELPGNSPYRQKQLGNGGGYVGGGGGMEGVGGDPGRERKVSRENIHAGFNGCEDSLLAQRRARCVFRVGRPCVRRSVLQGVARVLQSVAGCCRVLQGACLELGVRVFVVVCCRMLPVCCAVLLCVAGCCRVRV